MSPGRSLGVTGHRNGGLTGADSDILSRKLGGIMTGLGELGFSALVSPLAEGADRIVAWQALAVGWSLRVILPFPPVRYEEDFASLDSKEEFRDLLARSVDVEVLEPAGEGVGTEGGGEADDAGADLPYRVVGEGLLRRVALLVAIWDGQPPRGPGGTAEVVERARLRGIPVIWISSMPPHPVRLLEPGAMEPSSVEEPLEAHLPRLLRPWFGPS